MSLTYQAEGNDIGTKNTGGQKHRGSKTLGWKNTGAWEVSL